jgi:hypothetical protein
MVSLINFKTVDEDLSGYQPIEGPHEQVGPTPQSELRVAARQQQQTKGHEDASIATRTNGRSPLDASQAPDSFAADFRAVRDYYGCKPAEDSDKSQSQSPNKNNSSSSSNNNGNRSAAGQFTVTWRKLKFCIEPKWHERIASGPSALIALATGRVNSPSSSSATATAAAAAAVAQQQKTGLGEAGAAKASTTAPDCPQASANEQQQQQQPAPPAATRVVLDQLDGSFRSGELTAILGPSGK